MVSMVGIATLDQDGLCKKQGHWDGSGMSGAGWYGRDGPCCSAQLVKMVGMFSSGGRGYFPILAARMPTPHVSDELIEDSSAQSSEKEDEDEEEEEDDQEEESEEEEEARAWLLLRQQNGTLFICAAAFSCSRSMAVAAAVKWHALNLRSRVQLQQEHGCCCISRL
eukprot:s2643_g14.t1